MATPTMSLPMSRISLLLAIPMTTLPTVKTTLALRMVIFLPSHWLGMKESKAKRKAAPIVMETISWCHRSFSVPVRSDNNLQMSKLKHKMKLSIQSHSPILILQNDSHSSWYYPSVITKEKSPHSCQGSQEENCHRLLFTVWHIVNVQNLFCFTDKKWIKMTCRQDNTILTLPPLFLSIISMNEREHDVRRRSIFYSTEQEQASRHYAVQLIT